MQVESSLVSLSQLVEAEIFDVEVEVEVEVEDQICKVWYIVSLLETFTWDGKLSRNLVTSNLPLILSEIGRYFI